MAHDSLLTLKTDDAFLRRLRTAAKVPPSPQERLEQRVSFVVGAVDYNVTREQVLNVILGQQGAAHPA